MNLKEMDNALVGIIQDSDFTEAQRFFFLNQAYAEAIAQVRVPALKRMGSISTVAGQAYVSLATLTDPFGGWLSFARNANLDKIRIFAKLEELWDFFPDMTIEGKVVAIAVETNVLWYQYVPATPEVITFTYFTTPSSLVAYEDEPSYIPSHLHYPIVVCGAAQAIYNLIEDGQIEDKANWKANLLLFNQGVQKLHEWVAKFRPHHISSRMAV